MAKYLQARIVARWMDEGVQFLMPESVYVEPSVTFDPGVIVEPFVFLAGRLHFERNARITSGTRLSKPL
jgi:bifunctional N-acetylglucosamine-1-phosphate-uridyltransferase/glucosamine-1-phosphate-acetyltransferase GlmU-like protein